MDEQRRALQAQIEADVADFISSLDDDVPSGVPPPPKIEVTEVDTKPAEIEFLPFGTQGSDTTPSVSTPPPPPTEIGACCLEDAVCVLETEEECDLDGGVFQGIGTDCTPNPCEEPTGACCNDDGGCTIETQSDCEDAGFHYFGDDTTCEDEEVDCFGACCDCGNCVEDKTVTECEALQGFFQGFGTDCTPASQCCPEPDVTPTPAPDSCCKPCDGSNLCTGTVGYMSETGCYCTEVETYEDHCSVVVSPGLPEEGTYSRHLTMQFTNRFYWRWHPSFGCTNSTFVSCDYCTLTRTFPDGSFTVCNCCEESCTAGFCGDTTGGVDCGCEFEIVSDTVQHCEDSFVGDPPYNPTCDVTHTLTLSNNCET